MQTALVLAVIVLSALASWWLTRSAPRAPSATVPPPPELLADAPPEQAPEEVAAATSPKQLGAVGFCAPEGDEASFTLHHTLRGLIRKEFQRRWDALSNDERHEVTSIAGGRPATGNALLYTALKQPASPALLDAATRLAVESSDPYLEVTRALLADALNCDDVQLEALRRARRSLPHDPAIGWSLFALLRDTAELDEALEAVSDYLAADPIPAVARMKRRVEVQRDIQHDYRRQSESGLTLLWPPEQLSEANAGALLHAVSTALDDAAALTGTTRRAKLTIVVYPGREELLAVSCVQSWAGALYDGTLRLVAAPGEPMGVGRVSLRHEALHAQVIPLAPSAPRWFHEGLAQSFAGEVDRALPTWRLMVRNRSWIPFSSLGGTFQAFEQSEDARLAYAQSLALIELLRSSGGSHALQEAIRAFEEGAGAETVLQRATGHEVTGNELLRFLEQRTSSATNAEPK
jgi:hypothetical protein